MWPIRSSGFALKASVNIGRHRKAGRSVRLRMGRRCKIFFYLDLINIHQGYSTEQGSPRIIVKCS